MSKTKYLQTWWFAFLSVFWFLFLQLEYFTVTSLEMYSEFRNMALRLSIKHSFKKIIKTSHRLSLKLITVNKTKGCQKRFMVIIHFQLKHLQLGIVRWIFMQKVWINYTKKPKFTWNASKISQDKMFTILIKQIRLFLCKIMRKKICNNFG